MSNNHKQRHFVTKSHWRYSPLSSFFPRIWSINDILFFFVSSPFDLYCTRTPSLIFLTFYGDFTFDFVFIHSSPTRSSHPKDASTIYLNSCRFFPLPLHFIPWCGTESPARAKWNSLRTNGNQYSLSPTINYQFSPRSFRGRPCRQVVSRRNAFSRRKLQSTEHMIAPNNDNNTV